MGVKERKERDRAEMREMILTSAHRLFVDRGFEEVSIRNIAEAIEYSPATIYLYFKDKNEIFFALHTEAFKVFNEFLGPILQIADPFERLVAMGEKYLSFALMHPQRYEIMFIIESPMDCDENSENWAEGRRTLGFLEGLLMECQAKGRFKGHNPQSLAFMIWSQMHGMCSLELRNRTRCYPEESRLNIRNEAFESFKRILAQL